MREFFGRSLILKTITSIILLSAVLASQGTAAADSSCDTSGLLASWEARNIFGSVAPPKYALRLDGFFDGNDGHEVTFSNDNVRFDEYKDGFARLHGSISVAEFNNSGGPGRFASSWNMDVLFELIPDSIAQIVVTSFVPGFKYYTLLPDVFTELTNQNDTGDFANLWEVPGINQPFQVGIGANGKNNNFGASGWLNYIHNDNGTIIGDSIGHVASSDFLMDLVPAINCPADTTIAAGGDSLVCIPGFGCVLDTCYVAPAGIFSLSNDTVCFAPDTSGLYTIYFIGEDSCGNADTCITNVLVSGDKPPICNLPPDSTIIVSCLGSQTCLPVSAFDPDNNLLGCSIVSGPGTIVGDSLWCYTPTGNETVTVTINCVDSSGASCQGVFTVKFVSKQPPILVVDPPTEIKLCLPETVCINFAVGDPDNDIDSVWTNFGQIINNTVCFDADSSGVYRIVLSVVDSCGLVAVDSFDITISINEPPVIVDIDTSDVFQCNISNSICIPLTIDNADGQLVGLSILGFFNPGDSTVCFTADTSGRYCDQLIITNNCGLSDTISYCIDVIVNRPPVAACPPSDSITTCFAGEICLPGFTATDQDGNIAEIIVIGGSLSGDTVCFVPIQGDNAITLIVRDSCGLADSCTTIITVDINGQPPVVAFDSVSGFSLCQPQFLCLSFGVADPDGDVDSIWSDFTYAGNAPLICFFADTTGTYEINVFVRDRCGFIDSDTISFFVLLNTPPIVNLPDSVNIDFCFEQAICIPIEVSDDNVASIISNYQLVNDSVCFSPDTTGIYLVWVEVTDSCGLKAADTAFVTVSIPPPPVLELGSDFQALICEPGTFCIRADTLNFFDSVFVNYGTFDPITNLFCVTIDTSISDYLIVEITDSCGRVARDSLFFDILVNTPPLVKIPMPDTTIYLCQPSFVCLPLEIGFDNISLPDSSITVNRGKYENGQVCFVPYDSGDYTIIATATDSCGNVVADTAVVRILTDQFVDLACTGDTSIFICQPETLCFPLGNIPVWADIQVSGIATWYDSANNQVCFYAECGVRNRIIVRAITPCDTISCEFTVDVRCNLPPLVFLPADTSISLCIADTVGIPVGIVDPNGNISSIELPVWVIYNEFSGLILFMADTSGLYEIIVTVTDSCGASKSDRIIVSITIDEPPVCQLPADTSFFICGPTEISLPVAALDNDDRNPVCSVLSGSGTIFKGNWIYQADSDAVINVVVECRDKCDNVCVDSFRVTINLNEAPVCDLPSDTTFILCEITEICLPIFSADADGNLQGCEIVAGPGSLLGPNNKNVIASQASSNTTSLLWCYTPSKDTTFEVVIRCSDSCGAFCESSFNITIDLNEAPEAFCPADTSMLLCDLSDIFLTGFSATDINGDELVLSVNIGLLSGDTLFFTPLVGENLITFIATDSCGIADTCQTLVTVDTNSAPICNLVGDTTITSCVTQQICLPVGGSDIDGNLISCEIISGPGVIENGLWCYQPQANDTVDVVFRCTDECGEFCESSFRVIIDAGVAPVIENQFFSFKFCAEAFNRNLNVIATNNLSDPTIFELLFGAGSIDSLSGIITYLPDTPGVYGFAVAASNSCGSDTAAISDTIIFNRPPEIIGFDSTIYLCQVQEFCFDVFAFDPDGDSLQITLTQGPGQFTQLTDNSGKQCFMPVKTDTATYLFVYEVSDLCDDGSLDSAATYTQTVTITVILNQAPELEIPPDLDFFACKGDTVCFTAIASDSDGDPVTVEIISGTATVTNDSLVCIVPDTSGVYDIGLKASDSCGNSATHFLSINIIVNSDPDVILGDDFAIEGCTQQEICFGFSANDPDNNFGNVFSNIGLIIGQDSLCFLADTSGIYQIIVTAVDSCGAEDIDTIIVAVTLNRAPIVSLGPDTTRQICSGDSVCLSVIIDDDNISSVTSNYQLTNNVVCFVADTAGVYEVWVSAIDSCGVAATDTAYITVTIPPAPVLELGNDFRAVICEPGTFCIKADTINYYDSVFVNYGVFDPVTNLFCVTIDSSISDYLIVEIRDSCGRVARDSLRFDIQVNTPPSVEISMPDTTVYLCSPDYICLPLLFSDSQQVFADLDISLNIGNYSNGQVCFVPYDSGTYTIIASVTDSCGKISADTAVVTVLTDQFVDLRCPNDTSIFICQPETLCFPLGNIPVWADIIVSGIATWYDSLNNQVCFYAECGLRNRIIVKAVTPCDTITCEFTVSVDCNQPPVVLLPGDTTFVLCGPDSISIPVGIGDPDNNIVTINTNSWVFYEPFSSLLSFAADTEGVYILQVSAVDSCGAQATAQITVTVLLNEAPEISFALSDSVYVICVFGEICLPLDIFDREDNIINVVPSLGFYDSMNQQICFTPRDTVGLYCIDVIAIDSCGLADTTTKCISIENDRAIGLDCPQDTLISSLCFPGLVSRFIDVSGQPDSIRTSFGFFDESEIFFPADTSGFYTIDLSVYSPCSTLTCRLYFDVTIADSVAITCPADDSVTICGTDTLCYQILKSNSVESLSVTAPAFISGDSVCLPVAESGTYSLTIIGSGVCGADTCQVSITVKVNSSPVLVSAPDTTYDDCIIPEICVPFTVTDVDNNVDSIVGPDGILTGNEYCFTPPTQGLYNLVFTAYDSCGATGSDTTAIRISLSEANITCPTGTQSRTICRGDSATITVPLTPFDANVTIFLGGQPNGYYNHDLGLVVVFPIDSGTQEVGIIAEAKCKTDTCIFPLNVTLQEPPVVTCPAQIDTNICLNDGDSICFSVSVTGSDVQLSVSENAVLTDSTVCVPVSQDGTIQVITYAQGTCGFDSCVTTINVVVDKAPVLTLPQSVVVERCDFDTGKICIPGIFATDDSLLNITIICGPGTLELASLDSGQVCFEPDQNIYGTYTFCIQADDGCNQVVDSFTVEVVPGPDCNRCVILVIDPGECIPVGRTHDVYINIETNRKIGGFDLLVSYDATVTSFSNATKEGTEIADWEFFTYRLNSSSCGSACPSGTIRLTGIADISNGAAHPPVEALSPNGRFIKITFQVTNNQNIAGLFLPINFIWFDCGDNTFGDPSGNELFIDNKIYNAEAIIIWDEEDSISYPESNRLPGIGTPDSCIVPGAAIPPRRCIEFFNGGICILHPDSLTDRGDINLNNVPYEVADVVVFTNYFLFGLSAFTIDVPAQIAATDINADGITLSVADLVLLIRIILGDADPLPKLNPHEQELILQSLRSKEGIVISSNSSNGIGGAYLVFKLNSSETNIVPELTADAEHMDLRYHLADDELRILVFSSKGNIIKSGDHQILKLPVESGLQLELIKSEFADGEGRPYKSSSTEIELPTKFELYQNYPNPFNPSTNISFYLPGQSDWEISIYNVNGSLVRKLSGSNEAGMVEVLWDGAAQTGNLVASGVYFYRLEAGDFKRTRKMMMLK